MSEAPQTAHGWTLLFHDCLLGQLSKLRIAVHRAEQANSAEAANNANVKLFRAVSTLILETIPCDPGHARFRQGGTLGPGHGHWRRAKIGQRFRLFFRYDSASKIIIYAWINDRYTLRSAGSETDPYAVFRKMLDRGSPPDSWNALLAECAQNADKN